MSNITRVTPTRISMIRIKEAEKLDDILSKYALSNTQIINRQENYNVGDILLYHTKKLIYHVVKPNQTIEEIANIYNTTPEYLLKNNNCSVIFTGQMLVI